MTGVIENQRGLEQAGETHSRPRTFEVGADQQHLIAEQRLHLEPAVVDRQDDNPHLEVSAADRRRNVGRVLTRQPQPRVGIGRPEPGGQLGDSVVGRAAKHPDGDDAVTHRSAAPDRRQRIVRGAGYMLGVDQEDAAGAGQRQTAARAHKQRHAELTLQPAHLVRHRRLGAMQCAGRRVERPELGGSAEVEELLERQGNTLSRSKKSKRRFLCGRILGSSDGRAHVSEIRGDDGLLEA